MATETTVDCPSCKKVKAIHSFSRKLLPCCLQAKTPEQCVHCICQCEHERQLRLKEAAKDAARRKK